MMLERLLFITRKLSCASNSIPTKEDCGTVLSILSLIDLNSSLASTCGKKPVVKILAHGAVAPTEEEVARNPRARSAKLRVAQKLEVL